MGEEAAGADELLSQPMIGMPGLAEVSVELAAKFGLARSAELELLIDNLFGLSCRDQDENRHNGTPEEASRQAQADRSKRRSGGFALAKALRKDAEVMLNALERIFAALNNFNGDVVRDDPALLEAIFDVDCGPPDNLFIPPEIAILHAFFRSPFDDAIEEAEAEMRAAGEKIEGSSRCPAGFWEDVDSRLSALAAIPVRERLPSGPVPNRVLQEALASAKTYWCRQDGKSWSMSSLKARVTRRQNKDDTLKGECERFVHDLLNVCGFRFSLTELASTWAWVDANGA